MDLLEYWPTREHINQCIRTEAEELAEHTLLAVHEPMRLKRIGESEAKSRSDEDLLKEFLQVERPIPIIGRSGVGKSHLLRWLHAKLKVHPTAVKWHIVRIPKNASLRQVLELLLIGLEGEAFELARKRVKSVGEQLDTREVAELLLTFMGQQLRKNYNQTNKIIEQYRQSGTRPQPEEGERFRVIDLHCGDNGLPALINDPHFQENLLDRKHCIYQFAMRLTSGASDDELSDNDYQIHASDLDFNYNLSDLSRPAAEYVRVARLNTREEMRQEAATVLNNVLGEATRTAFRQLFQFGGSNFQELFKQIRRDLFEKGKTLVVLVEDMVAISAIEDVLIDSLLEEGLYDGVETMCSLRSAIAVTDGYPGYLRRRDTLRTRAQAEWWIEELQEGETEQVMQQRVVDFCSRYINAARHGSQALEKCWSNKEENPWPPIWENEEIDRRHLDAFDRARTGISLYPLSHLAINALVNRTCRDDQGRIRFNPRQVINKILLEILRECRIDAEHGQFPPPALASVSAPVSLRSDLAILGLRDQVRCESLAAIWGYGAENLEELKKKFSADIALSFGFTDLAGHLQSGVVVPPSAPETERNEAEETEVHLNSVQSPPDPREQRLIELLDEVDLWCKGEKELGQTEAKELRKALALMYQTYVRKEWTGVADLPPIKSGAFVYVEIPNAKGNRAGNLVNFCSEKDFTDPIKSIPFHDAAQAMLRYSFFNPVNGERKGWNYSKGHEDFLHYQNFAAYWVPGVLRTLRDLEREKLVEFVAAHVGAARTLAVFRKDDNSHVKLNKLLQSQQALAERFSAPVCEIVQTRRDDQLIQWDFLQEKWRKLLASSDHGLDGDIALAALKKALKVPPPNIINRDMARSFTELRQEIARASLFGDCTTVDDFNDILESLGSLIGKLQTAGKYPTSDGVVTSATLRSNIKKVAGTGLFDQVKKMRRLSESSDVEQQWLLLNELDGVMVKFLTKTMSQWQCVLVRALPALQSENSKWGAEKVMAAEENIDSLLDSLLEIVKDVQGGTDDNA